MAAEKAIALVLRVVEFSESSCVVTLFTREFGKVGVLAKGARRLKAPFDSAIDLLTLCRIVFLRKSSGGLDLLTEAKLERRFRPSSHDLARVYAGYYVAELLLGLTDEYDPHAKLFDETSQMLAALATGADILEILVRYELTVLRELGHLPSLYNCVQCNEPVAGPSRIAFGQLSGGVLCPRCRPGKKQVVSITADTLDVMRHYAAEKFNLSEPFTIDPKLRGELRGVLNQYIANLLGHRPKMHKYLALLGGHVRSTKQPTA